MSLRINFVSFGEDAVATRVEALLNAVGNSISVPGDNRRRFSTWVERPTSAEEFAQSLRQLNTAQDMPFITVVGGHGRTDALGRWYISRRPSSVPLPIDELLQNVYFRTQILIVYSCESAASLRIWRKAAGTECDIVLWDGAVDPADFTRLFLNFMLALAGRPGLATPTMELRHELWAQACNQFRDQEAGHRTQTKDGTAYSGRFRNQRHTIDFGRGDQDPISSDTAASQSNNLKLKEP